MKRETLEVMYARIENDRAKIRSLQTSVEDSIVDYRIKSACRVLDYLCVKSCGDKGVDNKELNMLLVHCLNKLYGNIDGCELNL